MSGTIVDGSAESTRSGCPWLRFLQTNRQIVVSGRAVRLLRNRGGIAARGLIITELLELRISSGAQARRCRWGSRKRSSRAPRREKKFLDWILIYPLPLLVGIIH